MFSFVLFVSVELYAMFAPWQHDWYRLADIQTFPYWCYEEAMCS